jgi:hypothetical protein
MNEIYVELYSCDSKVHMLAFPNKANLQIQMKIAQIRPIHLETACHVKELCEKKCFSRDAGREFENFALYRIFCI